MTQWEHFIASSISLVLVFTLSRTSSIILALMLMTHDVYLEEKIERTPGENRTSAIIYSTIGGSGVEMGGAFGTGFPGTGNHLTAE